jgi:beta-lactamase regulating signal transducer with metallopeptidase domain
VHVVVNWLWQGSALTLVAAIALRSAPRMSATTRYLVWWTTMILVLVLPILPRLISVSGAPAPPTDAVTAISPMPLPNLPAWPLIIGVGCWAVWVAIALVRVIVSFVTLVHARRVATPFPSAREARLTHWASVQSGVQSGSRRARLVLSDRVVSAAVLGLGRAVIAVSPVAARRLTDEELDQVLLHEWAHVQRYDDFARLAQIAIRSVAGMHPAVWWIGRRLEIEREIACDDYAVNVTGAARRLALCLTKLAEVPPRTVNASLVPGALVSSQLTMRVLRLLDPRRNTSTRRACGLLGSLAAVLAMLAVVLSHVELVVAASPFVGPMPAEPVVTKPVLQTPSSLLAPVTDAFPSREVVVSSRKVWQPSPSERAPNQTDSVTTPASQSVGAPNSPAPIERVGSGAWYVPELPTLSSGAVFSPTAPAATLPAIEDSPDRKATTPWGAAADAGISVGHGSQKAAAATADAGTSLGRGSQKAAVATAGFFSKIGRKIAGGF